MRLCWKMCVLAKDSFSFQDTNQLSNCMLSCRAINLDSSTSN